MNSVNITCRLTQDPELRSTPSGKSVGTLRVAIPRPKSGEGEDRGADFLDVTLWGPLAETCSKYLAKGRQVAINGRLEHSEWEADDGSRRQRVQVVARDVEFLGAPRTEDNGTSEPAGTGTAAEDIAF